MFAQPFENMDLCTFKTDKGVREGEEYTARKIPLQNNICVG